MNFQVPEFQNFILTFNDFVEKQLDINEFKIGLNNTFLNIKVLDAMRYFMSDKKQEEIMGFNLNRVKKDECSGSSPHCSWKRNFNQKDTASLILRVHSLIDSIKPNYFAPFDFQFKNPYFTQNNRKVS